MHRSEYSYLNSEEKLKKLEELQEQLRELKQNMNATEVIAAHKREIWKSY